MFRLFKFGFCILRNENFFLKNFVYCNVFILESKIMYRCDVKFIKI